MNAHLLLRFARATCVRSATLALTLMAVATSTGCSHGTRASDIPWSQGPQGAPANVELVTGGMIMKGELLAVDTSGVLLQSTIISHIPWTVMRSLKLRGLGREYHVSGRARPSMATIQRLSLVSHFPQGIDPAVLTKLLETTKQKAVEEVR